jgi:hypothetical protein
MIRYAHKHNELLNACINNYEGKSVGLHMGARRNFCKGGQKFSMVASKCFSTKSLKNAKLDIKNTGIGQGGFS